VKRVCFTGHRPDKIGGYDRNNPLSSKIRESLEDLLWDMVLNTDEKEFIFTFGGALGIDQMAYDVVETVRNGMLIPFPDVKISLVVAVPFQRQCSNWKEEDRIRYSGQLSRADMVVYVDTLYKYKIPGQVEDAYYIEKMQKRNEFMVNNSDVVIAVWDGSSGGTGNCVKYAERKGKEIIKINPKELI
jgi:uncharacterized phage-like protein YoqJ